MAPEESAGPRRLRPSGGYRSLRSFRVATIIYDATVSFCARFMSSRSRTVDQMTQAARSGRQNISEGSRAAAVSSQAELRLVNVARASLEELLLDFEDFLRQRGQLQWGKEDPEAMAVRAIRLSEQTARTDQTDPADRLAYSRWLSSEDPAMVANAMICIIHQANYLLDRQISALEQAFIHEGGYSERLAAARIEARRHAAPQASPAPVCPACDWPMALRTARTGSRAGAQSWGCSACPECRHTLPLDGATS